MIRNANIFECIIFLGKTFSKKLDTAAYVTVLKDERTLFVLLQILYFGGGLRSIKFVAEDTVMEFSQV